ncbi:hypothetical protein C5167_043280 [Papaver somniferum]|uniref:Uncharacterized protein n=1 Tax=Papaver somniferum TaxID=3469 RepID=A0A4Y7L7S2_PAPSO|nr:hypothetical protein C5167_043280 [Papaver somniferum]
MTTTLSQLMLQFKPLGTSCFHRSASPSSTPFSLRTPNKLLFNGGYSTSSTMYPHQQQTIAPLLSRQSFIPRISGIFDALTGGNSSREAIIATRKGMVLFRQGDVLGSLAEFDRAIELDPRQKACDLSLWINVANMVRDSLKIWCFCRFEEGAEQFRLDVAQNPNDTEESIWCFLCEAQLYGEDEARKKFLEVGVDPRPVMRQAYSMFKDGGDPEKLASAFLRGKEHERFYASLYAGLYYESQNNPEAAKVHILAACQSPYGSRADDYMAALAKVHAL